MRKKIEVFGRKIPVVAILIVALIVGTASAAVFMNYATLSGTSTVTNSISVTDNDEDLIEIGGEGNLTFESPATFTINNNGDDPVIVELESYLELDDAPVTDETGLTVDLSVIDGTGVEDGTVLVPPGGLTVDVTFDAIDNAMPGEYEIFVEVNPYMGTETYATFDGDNEMVDVTLTHKDGAPDWNPTGDNSSLAYAAMGDEFYYELDANGLNADTSYSLIYYADPWAGNNPGALIHAFVTDSNGDIIVSGHTDLGIDLPHADDNNFDEGAKVWVVLTADLDSGSLPMAGWNPGEYLYEYSEILDDDYTDLVRYEDTNL